MECNKEEAMRAKGIAENRMLKKDFVGARKFALKAQQLYPDLENISQMIMVCDVHCSSINKVGENERDWYSILNIDPSADELSIRKKYRKFALSLHPDKNSFPGSTDAFKLIGEAQMVLLDRNKRLIYDSKYNAAKESRKPSVAQGFRNNSVNKGMDTKDEQPRRKAQTGSSNDQAMFWTLCPSCCIKFRFSVDLINKSVWCQICKTYFTGEEIKAPPTSARTYSSSWKIPRGQNKRFFKPKPSTTWGNSEPKVVFQENTQTEKRTRESVQNSEIPQTHKKFKFSGACGHAHGKIVEGAGGYPHPQRCTQSKLHAFYSERSSEDPFQEQKRPQVKTADNHFAHVKEDIDEVKFTENGNGTIEGSNCKSVLETYEYPCGYTDPDFHDFDKYRREECFQLGQVWAIYDTVDAMPRFYALIREVFSPGFKLLITWLEPNPDDEQEVRWVYEGLPVSCGRFKYGDSEIVEDCLIFSHLVLGKEEIKFDAYRIYPKKGETWALFKNWDINWPSVHDFNKKCEFDFVKIISDYAEDTGVSVAYMGKVKGFSCLFCQTMQSFQIHPNQLFRFSHRVPSFLLGNERREGVPKGSFELDPASLPPNVEEIKIYSSEILKSKVGNLSKPFLRPCLVSNFNDFDKDRIKGCFSVGQIWALYDILDGMPRFYARVEQILSPVFKLQITWLEPEPNDNEEIKRFNKGLPVACGNFKLGNSETIEDNLMFSHLVLAENGGESGTYKVYPRKGETWALFEDWDVKWNSCLVDKRSCAFEFVEILSNYDKYLGVFVAHLSREEGFSCLFSRAENEMKSFQIPPNHLFRFSHKIPSFRMKVDGKKDIPEGSFELDTCSLPSFSK